MKKYLLCSGVLVIGIIIGSLLVLGLSRSFSDSIAVINIAQFENLSSEIYKSGDYNASVIILRFLSEKLKSLEEASGDESLARRFRIDRGLAHGRLYLLYKGKGKENLAHREYIVAIKLLGNEYNIATEEEVRMLVERIDSEPYQGD